MKITITPHGRNITEMRFLADIGQLEPTERPGSMFYVEPTFYGILEKVEGIIEKHHRPLPGFLVQSSFSVRHEYPVIKVYKQMHTKADVQIAEINFLKT